MLAAPKHGFAYLATRKTGSTAIQRDFAPHAQLLTNGPPSLKHVTATEFEATFVPLLRAHGFDRGGYETVCAIRHPLDAAVSWWRYRSRPALEGHPNHVGQLAFDAFAEQLIAGKVTLPSQADFVCDTRGHVAVDRLYRYDHLDKMIEWMRARVGKPVTVGRANVSPPRDPRMSPDTRHMLEDFYSGELALYAQAA